MKLVFHESMTKNEIHEQVVKFMAQNMAKTYLEIAEADKTVSKEKLEIFRKEYADFENKLENEMLVFGDDVIRLNDDNTDIRDTTDEPGKIRDSGEEKPMKITERATRALERIAAKGEEEDLKEAVENAVKKDGHRESSGGNYYPHLDPDHPTYVKETKKNLSLDEDTMLEAVRKSEGITNEGQKSTDINKYHSPESVWNKRLLEKTEEGKKSKTVSGTEDEVLAAVTRG
jgi:hypothetical protein